MDTIRTTVNNTIGRQMSNAFPAEDSDMHGAAAPKECLRKSENILM